MRVHVVLRDSASILNIGLSIVGRGRKNPNHGSRKVPSSKKLDTYADAPTFAGVDDDGVALLNLKHISPKKCEVIVQISDWVVRV